MPINSGLCFPQGQKNVFMQYKNRIILFTSNICIFFQIAPNISPWKQQSQIIYFRIF